MGTSHFKSNVAGFAGTETIRNFTTISATTLTDGTISISAGAISGVTTLAAAAVYGANTVTATSINVSGSVALAAGKYLKMGAKQYLFFGSESAEATIVALATAVNASVKGSLYLDRTTPAIWFFDSDSAATIVTL